MGRYAYYEVTGPPRRWWHRRRPGTGDIVIKLPRREHGDDLHKLALAVDAMLGPGRWDTRPDGTMVYRPEE